MMTRRGFQTIPLHLEKANQDVNVYTSPKIADALTAISEEINLFHGVKLLQVLEAVYTQGKKDGAREAFSEVQSGLTTAMNAVPHVNPGRPARKKAARKKAARKIAGRKSTTKKKT